MRVSSASLAREMSVPRAQCPRWRVAVRSDLAPTPRADAARPLVGMLAYRR